jgi:C-terminal processing protease CtpA/Prc
VIRQNRTRNQAKYPNLKSLFPQPPYLSLTINEQQRTAVLKIKWFQNDVLQGANEQFKPFIDSVFTTIQAQKIDNLVIDIRNNGGGESENASYLYAYLTQQSFRFLHAMEANEKTYKDDLKRSIQYQPATGTNRYQTVDSTTQYQQLFGFNVQQPVQYNYTGKLYVLIDGLTTSAAAQFAALVKQNKRGVLIGEAAPGSLYGGSGRGYSYFYLPHSGLLTMISQYRLYMSDPGKKVKDVVIIPDHKPQRSIQDTLSGKDKDLEYAEKLISTNPGR